MNGSVCSNHISDCFEQFSMSNNLEDLPVFEMNTNI